VIEPRFLLFAAFAVRGLAENAPELEDAPPDPRQRARVAVVNLHVGTVNDKPDLRPAST
jgi:hypothetical protein